jgi:type II secretory pathway component PulF
MRELTAIGEESGKLDDVYKQLAEHYRGRMEMRRLFLSSIAWPMFQLFAAIFVVGLLILIIGFLQEMNPKANLDVLRLGLVGKKGLVIYCAFIAFAAAAIWFLVHAISRGLAWTRFVQYFILRIPALGKTLEKIYLTRFVWTLHITFDSGMEIRRAVRLSLKSAGNAYYADRIPEIEQSISKGNSLHESFAATGCFPADFLDALAVGEQSGRISQTLENLSRQYQDQSRLAVSVLTRIAGYVVWAIVVLILVIMIFRVAGSYVNMLNNAANGNF